MFVALPALVAYLNSTACAVACTAALGGTWPATVLQNLGTHGVITLNASAATMPCLTINKEHDIAVQGGHYGPCPTAGVLVEHSTNMAVNNTATDSAVAGVSFYMVPGVEASNNTITRSTGDGLDLYGVQNAKVIGTVCLLNVLTTTHPDCVQGASLYDKTGVLLPGGQNQNIDVSHTFASGDTMGVEEFDHFSPGGTNITFHDNIVATSQFWCSGLEGVTGGSITNTRCITVPGSKYKAQIQVVSSTGIVQSGNRLDGVLQPASGGK